jgi:hypothetical protein
MIKIYNLGQGVFEDYIAGTVRGKHCNKFMVKLKLSAMIASTSVITKWDNLKIYRIGTFSIVVKDTTPNIISLVYWGDRSYPLNKETKEKLKKSYALLGLSPDGQSYIGLSSDIKKEVDCSEKPTKD